METNKLIKNSLVIYAILFFAIVSFATEEKSVKDIDAISKLLQERTNGNDAFYSKALSPAQSLDVDKSKADRIEIANKHIVDEIALVLSSFKSVAEDKKITSVYQAAALISPDLVKNSGVFVTFFDSNPSAAISRTLLMIPKSVKPGLTAESILNILTSYKHSPKQSDHIFEYEVAQNLTQGHIIHVEGSDSSWIGKGSLSPLAVGEDFVLKKCRQLLGWRCVTSLYRADSLLKGEESVKSLFISAYDLEKNPDHADFANDKRSKNQITGSTAIYIVKESSEWILLYGVDTQWNNGKLSFQGAIQTEFKKDFERFKERICSDLGISVDQIK